MKRKRSVLPFVLFALALFLLSSYALSGLHTLNSSPFITPVFWAFTIGLIVCVFISFSGIGRTGGMGWFFKISTHIFLVLLAAELVLSILLLAGDAPRLFTGQPRNLYWTEFAFGAFILTVCIFLYGMLFGKYKYRVIRHVLYFDDLPENFEGFTVTQISDIHSGSFKNAAAVERGIQMVNDQQSDLFVFTGDLVNFRAEEIKPWIPAFAKINAPYGQFSVLGNHDYGGSTVQMQHDNQVEIKRYHQEIGFKLLLDSHVHIEKGGQHINLIGVENWGIGFGERGDLDKAMHAIPEGEFNLLLSHDPSHWEAKVKSFEPKIQLTLSGHTHGMQFGLEAFGIKWSPVKYRYAHWAGLKTEFGRTLNINRGFGFIGFSGRVGIWPEITVIELRKTKVSA
jgi:predicted MPP superfamily phosphohydrolase